VRPATAGAIAVAAHNSTTGAAATPRTYHVPGGPVITETTTVRTYAVPGGPVLTETTT
jgi:hypothetical protein